MAIWNVRNLLQSIFGHLRSSVRCHIWPLTIRGKLFWSRNQIFINLLHTIILPNWTQKKGTLQFCLPALQGIHRHPMQKEFFRSTEGFLRAALTGHGHPGPLWKIAKMALFDPCMEFENWLGQMTSFQVLCLTISKKHLRLCAVHLRPCAYLGA